MKMKVSKSVIMACIVMGWAGAALAGTGARAKLAEAVSLLNMASANYSAAASNCGSENVETTKAELKSIYKRIMDKTNVVKMLSAFDSDYSLRKGMKCDAHEAQLWLDRATAKKIEVYDLITEAGY